MNSNNIAIYLHIPFCVTRCLYCDYISSTKVSYIEKYFNYMSKEIDLYKNKLNAQTKIETIYIGGGTPSFVFPERINKIVKKITNSFHTDIQEFTIELNPESVDLDNLWKYYNMGVNRISLGVQSFNNSILEKVKRPHKTKEVIRAYKNIKNVFKNINVDFILGLPGETKSTLKNNLDFIKSFNPNHVSYYLLDDSHIEDKFDTPSKENLENYLDYIYERLSRMGYNRYEISSWEKNNTESLHNRFYWKNQNYLGFGISAGGYYNGMRYNNEKNFIDYFKKIENEKFPYEYKYFNNEFEDFLETLFMGLRLSKGLNLKVLERRYPYVSVKKIVKKIKEKFPKYVEVNNKKIFLNKRGFDYSRLIFEFILSLEAQK